MTSRKAIGFVSAMLVAVLMNAAAAPGHAQHQNTDIMIDPTTLLGFVLGDWNADFRQDRAILVESDEGGGADLLVYLSDGRDKFSRAIHAPDIAWVGGMAGQKPSLERRDNGSLVVVSENETIGRDRWRIELTIAHRNGEMLVGGFTMTTRDSLDPDAASYCDINLFTGRGVRDDAAITTTLRASAVERWNMDRIPEECSPR